MNSKISDKDKKDWDDFLSSSEKLPNKDFTTDKKKSFKTKHIDLHGFTLEKANKAIEKFINDSYQNQISLIKETYRVSKKYIFIQTPNRYYPIDFHTTLPFIHWLPKNIHRKILKFLGLKFTDQGQIIKNTEND